LLCIISLHLDYHLQSQETLDKEMADVGSDLDLNAELKNGI